MTATAAMTRETPASVALRDGRRVTIRQLTSSDGTALVRAYQRADPRDLRRRFMGCPPPAEFVVRQLARADGVHDLVIGAFDFEGTLVGTAQFDRVGDVDSAEVAIEVATEWQHAGLGVALMTRLKELALELGIREFTATYLAENVAIRRLLRDTGRVIETAWDSGEGSCRIALSVA